MHAQYRVRHYRRHRLVSLQGHLNRMRDMVVLRIFHLQASAVVLRLRLVLVLLGSDRLVRLGLLLECLLGSINHHQDFRGGDLRKRRLKWIVCSPCWTLKSMAFEA